MAKQEEQDENSLTPAEWKVMKVVWRFRGQGCAARDVYMETAKTEGWAPTTTKSLLRRLVDKGIIKARPVGTSHLYEPAGTAVNSLLNAADSLLNNILEGTTGLVVTHILEKCDLTDDELAKLQKLIEQRTQTEKPAEEISK